MGVDPALLPSICTERHMKSRSTKAAAVPLGLAGALGRASCTSKPPEALLAVVIQLEFKDAFSFPDYTPPGTPQEQ